MAHIVVVDDDPSFERSFGPPSKSKVMRSTRLVTASPRWSTYAPVLGLWSCCLTSRCPLWTVRGYSARLRATARSRSAIGTC